VPNPQPWGDGLPRPAAPTFCYTVVVNGRCLPANSPQLRQGNLDNHADNFAQNVIGLQADNPECELLAKQVVCFNVEGVLADGHPQTIGDFLLYPGSKKDFHDELDRDKQDRADVAKQCDKNNRCLDPNVFGPDLEGHEAKHSDQWTKYADPTLFGAAYGYEQTRSQANCGKVGICNWFELDANPFKGRYWKAPVLGADGYFHPAPGTPDLDYVQHVLDTGP
jgi:hypothetical protein